MDPLRKGVLALSLLLLRVHLVLLLTPVVTPPFFFRPSAEAAMAAVVLVLPAAGLRPPPCSVAAAGSGKADSLLPVSAAVPVLPVLVVAGLLFRRKTDVRERRLLPFPLPLVASASCCIAGIVSFYFRAINSAVTNAEVSRGSIQQS